MIFSLILIRFEKLEQRTRMDVCSKFKKEVYSVKYQDGAYLDQNGTCSQPTYDKATDDTRALIELNYTRWLVGFDTKTELTNDYDDQVIQCAMNCAANGRLSHYPESNSSCYTPAAYAGCSTSNLAASSGYLNAATALQQLIDDQGGNNLEVGHRRWILYSGLTKTTFGGAYNSEAFLSNAVAQKVIFDDSESGKQLTFTAYPPPGYFPAQFVYSRFSFWAPGIPLGADVNVTVKINDVPQNLSEFHIFTEGGVGDYSGGAMFAMEKYPYISDIVNKRIDVQVTYKTTVYDYTIYPIDCSDKPMRTPVPTAEGDKYNSQDIGEAPKKQRQKKVAIGAGVGVSLAVIVIVVIVLFIVFRHGCSINHDNDETNNNNNDNNDNNDDQSNSGENHLEDA